MRTLVDDELRAQAAALSFRYRCADCAHFDVDTGSCAEGFPNEVHRERSVELHGYIEFCKSFELG